MKANATEVPASSAYTQRKERSARNPATAPPMANARLPENRTRANAVTRCPSGTRSAMRALLAGRHVSVATPARNATTTTAS